MASTGLGASLFLAALMTCALLGVGPAAGAPEVVDARAPLGLQAPIDAGQEGPPSRSGTGFACLELDLSVDPPLLAFDVRVRGLSGDIAVSHLHGPAAPGQSAPPVYVLAQGAPPQGVLQIVDKGAYTAAEQIVDLVAGRWYVNVHSSTFPSGEVRGQVGVGPVALHARMDAVSQNPSDDGSGSASFALDGCAARETLAFAFEVRELSGAVEAFTHLHVGEPGEVGPIVYVLSVGASDPRAGLIVLDDLLGAYPTIDQIDDLVGGRWYIDTHSDDFPAGDIRGQVLLPEPGGGSLLALLVVAGLVCASRRGGNPDYRPLKTGFRFSANAFTASR